MNVRSKLKPVLAGWGTGRNGISKDPLVIMRGVLVLLVAANVIAALIYFKPWGASPQELERQLAQLESQLAQKEAAVARLQTLVEKSNRARVDGDAFMAEYFMGSQTASSTIITELGEAAVKAGIKQEEQTFAFEPVEGSDNISMLTISGNYSGTYENLVRFVHAIDRSPRFLILDTLTAAPERTAGTLKVNLQMNAFVIERPAEGGFAPPGEKAGEEDKAVGDPPSDASTENAAEISPEEQRAE